MVPFDPLAAKVGSQPVEELASKGNRVKMGNKVGIPNVVRKGLNYWHQMKVPVDIKPSLGKSNYLINLNTSDLRVVKARALRARTRTLDLFDRLRRDGSDTRLLDQEAAKWREAEITCYGETPEVEALETKALLIDDRAEEIEKEHGEEAAGSFYRSATGQVFDAHLDAWFLEVAVSPKTEDARRLAAKNFMDFAESPSLSQVDRFLVGRFVSHLLGDNGLGRVTVNQKVNVLKGYWSFLHKKGHVAEGKLNLFADQSVPTPSFKSSQHNESGKKRPWTDAELKALVEGLGEQEDRVLEGFVMISSLSGMRVNEIAELRVGWCRDGIFDIQHSKTRAGLRKVPIHSGLLEIVEKRIAGKADDAYLFSELLPPPKPSIQRSSKISKKFKRFRLKVIVDLKPKGQRQSPVDFHSLRRWFITKAEQAGQIREIIEAVVGHKRQGESFGRYSGGPSIAQRRACVEAIKLPINAPA